MNHTPLFDALEGQRLKEQGMSLAAGKRHDALESAKDWAKYLAKREGEITIDHVYAECPLVDLLGNAAGNVFRGPDWEFTGKWVKSTRVSNHGRFIRVWRLK